MKKFLMAIFMITSASCLMAELRYDPLADQFYSWPSSPEINQAEYHQHYMQVVLFINNIMRSAEAVGTGIFSDETLAEQQSKALRQTIETHLMRIGTPTALRVLSDFKETVTDLKVDW